MSTLAQTAKQEGDDAEAAEDEEPKPDDEPEPEPEPEPAPEPAPEGVTDTEAEAIFAALDKYDETHMKTFLKKVGALHTQFMPCPLCITRGFVQPAAAGPVTSDREQSIMRQIGRAVEPDFQAAPDYERCPQCDGWGDVLTGAQKEISRTAACNLCGGKGFRNVIVPVNLAQANGAPAYPGADQTFTPLPQGIPDAWGRPAGHVHWGIDPANVGV